MSLAPLRRRLCTSAALNFGPAKSAARPPVSSSSRSQERETHDGMLDDDFGGPGKDRAGELIGFLATVVENSPTVQSSAFRYKSQSIIRPTDLHRETRARLQQPTRRRPLPTYGRLAQHTDVFRQLGIDPRCEADNRQLMSGYVNGLGRIMPRAQTGLSMRSQRLVGKAIKRSKMMGVIPWFSNSRFSFGAGQRKNFK